MALVPFQFLVPFTEPISVRLPVPEPISVRFPVPEPVQLPQVVAADVNIKTLKRSRNEKKLQGDEAESLALKQAEEFRSQLEQKFPSFAKYMKQSHVSGCFWLGLQKNFCQSHLPNTDTQMFLVNEDGKEYNTLFLAAKTGLSAGWRNFSNKNKLVVGDALVFYLIEATKFKVYIVRANTVNGVNRFLSLSALNAHPLSVYSGNCIMESNKRPRNAASNLITQTSSPKKPATEFDQLPTRPEKNLSEVSSDDVDVLEGIKFAETVLEFKDVVSFERFTVAVNGLIIDSELPDCVRFKYYELCCSQKVFLHEHVFKGINYKLVVGMIYQTVTIADAISVNKLGISQDEFKSKDTFLSSFEELGMNVGFLRVKLEKLLSLTVESESARRQGEAIGGKSSTDAKV